MTVTCSERKKSGHAGPPLRFDNFRRSNRFIFEHGRHHGDGSAYPMESMWPEEPATPDPIPRASGKNVYPSPKLLPSLYISTTRRACPNGPNTIGIRRSGLSDGGGRIIPTSIISPPRHRYFEKKIPTLISSTRFPRIRARGRHEPREIAVDMYRAAKRGCPVIPMEPDRLETAADRSHPRIGSKSTSVRPPQKSLS